MPNDKNILRSPVPGPSAVFNQLLGSSTIPCLLADPSCFQILDVNPSAATLFDTSRQNLRGKTLADVLMPAHWEALRTSIESGTPAPQVEESYRRPDGASSICVLTHQSCHVEDNDACLVFLYDVTETVEKTQRAAGRTQLEIEAERIAREHAALTWERLATNRNLLLTFLEMAPLSVYVKDIQGRYLFHNRFAKDLCAITDESVGKTDWDLFPLDIAEGFRRADYAVLESNRTIETVEILRQNGVDQHFLSIKFPIEDEQRNRYVCGMSIDISEQVRSDNERRSLTQLLDLAVQPIIAVDLADIILFWNNGAEALYGFTREEVTGKCVHELLQTVFPTPLDNIEKQYARDGYWEGEVIHHTKDGRELVIISRWSAARDVQGQRYARLILNSDITDARRAAKALAESEQRFRAIAETLPYFVWTAMPLGNASYITPRWYEYTGLNPGDEWFTAIHPDDRQAIAERTQLASSTNAIYVAEYRIHRAADKTFRWHRTEAVPLFDHLGQLREWVGVTAEIHDAKIAELKTRQLDRVTGATEAARSLANEISNPLTTLSNLVYLLQQESLEPRAHSFVEDAFAALQRVNHLVRSIHEFYSGLELKNGLSPEVFNTTYIAGAVVPSSGIYTNFHPTFGFKDSMVLVRGQKFPACVCCGGRSSFELNYSAPYIFDDEDFKE